MTRTPSVGHTRHATASAFGTTVVFHVKPPGTTQANCCTYRAVANRVILFHVKHDVGECRRRSLQKARALSHVAGRAASPSMVNSRAGPATASERCPTRSQALPQHRRDDSDSKRRSGEACGSPEVNTVPSHDPDHDRDRTVSQRHPQSAQVRAQSACSKRPSSRIRTNWSRSDSTETGRCFT